MSMKWSRQSQKRALRSPRQLQTWVIAALCPALLHSPVPFRSPHRAQSFRLLASKRGLYTSALHEYTRVRRTPLVTFFQISRAPAEYRAVETASENGLTAQIGRLEALTDDTSDAELIEHLAAIRTQLSDNVGWQKRVSSSCTPWLAPCGNLFPFPSPRHRPTAYF